jgi:hypothetical protein
MGPGGIQTPNPLMRIKKLMREFKCFLIMRYKPAILLINSIIMLLVIVMFFVFQSHKIAWANDYSNVDMDLNSLDKEYADSTAVVNKFYSYNEITAYTEKIQVRLIFA